MSEKTGVTTVETDSGILGSLFGGRRTKTTVPATKEDIPKKEEPEPEQIDVTNYILNFVIQAILIIVGTIGGYILFQKLGGSPSPIMIIFLLILNYQFTALKYIIIIAVALLPIFYGKQLYTSKQITSLADLATKNSPITSIRKAISYRPSLPK